MIKKYLIGLSMLFGASLGAAAEPKKATLSDVLKKYSKKNEFVAEWVVKPVICGALLYITKRLVAPTLPWSTIGLVAAPIIG